VFPVVERAAF